MPLITPTFSQGEKVGPVEMALVDAAIREVANWFYDLFGQQQTVMPGGFAMTAQAGPGINFQQAGGRCFINGDRGIIPAGPLTCNSNTDPTNHRYDLVTVQYTEPSGTDSAGQAEAVDTFTVIVVPGVVAGSPVLPSLPVNAVQIGWVDVGPNATTSAGCTAHSSAADQGPFVFVSYQAFANHMNASLANSVVHGFQATSPGGTGALQLAQTDSQGRVGHALTADSATTAVSAGSAQNAVQASNAATLGGIGPNGFDAAGQAGLVQANLSGHQALNQQAQQAHNLMFQHGTVGPLLVRNQQQVVFTITFPVAFPGVPTVTASIAGNSGVQYGQKCERVSVSATQATYNVGQTSGSDTNLSLDWHAAY